MSKEELEKTAIELADEYIASFEGQLTLGTVCKGGVEAIGLLLLSTPEELMRLSPAWPFYRRLLLRSLVVSFPMMTSAMLPGNSSKKILARSGGRVFRPKCSNRSSRNTWLTFHLKRLRS